MTKKYTRSVWPAAAVFLTISLGLWAGEAPAQRSTATTAGRTPSGRVKAGTLIRAGQMHNGTPRFALLGRNGAVTSYVVAPAGVDLGAYVGQPIRVRARVTRRGTDGIEYLVAQQVQAAPIQANPIQANPIQAFQVPAARTQAAVRNRAATTSVANRAATTRIQEPELLDVFAAEPLDGGDSQPASVGLIADVANVAEAPPVVPAAAVSRPMSVPAQDPWGGFADDAGLGPAEPTTFAAATGPVAAQAIPGPPPLRDTPAAQPAAWHRTSGHLIHHQPPIESAGYGFNGTCCDGSGCDLCGTYPTAACQTGRPGQHWVRAEYLLFWAKGMDVPPLITTSPSGTDAGDAGVLGLATTNTLLGDEAFLEDSRNGGRFRVGRWLGNCQWRGIEVDYFFVSQEHDRFRTSSSGTPILARPFYNALLDQQDAELVAFPGIVAGSMAVTARSELHSVAPRFRINIINSDYTANPADSFGACDACGVAQYQEAAGRRIDLLVGYRYLRLDEGLRINETLVTGQGSTLSAFELVDSFQTETEFHGAELGLLWEAYRGPWSLEVLGRVAVGNNRKVVQIDGSTTTSSGGVSSTDTGGLLALGSNIGTFTDDEFVAIPEIGVTLGYQIAPSLNFNFGYTFLYWDSVARPGEQIDLRVNPDLIPPALATPGPAVPAVTMADTDYWVQGLRLGFDWRW